LFRILFFVFLALVMVGCARLENVSTMDLLLNGQISERKRTQAIIAQLKKYVTPADFEKCRDTIRAFKPTYYFTRGRGHRVASNSKFWIGTQHTCLANFKWFVASANADESGTLAYFTNATVLDSSGKPGTSHIRGCFMTIQNGKVTKLRFTFDEIKVRLGTPCTHI
jgi:hypothetical protein